MAFFITVLMAFLIGGGVVLALVADDLRIGYSGIADTFEAAGAGLLIDALAVPIILVLGLCISTFAPLGAGDEADTAADVMNAPLVQASIDGSQTRVWYSSPDGGTEMMKVNNSGLEVVRDSGAEPTVQVRSHFNGIAGRIESDVTLTVPDTFDFKEEGDGDE